MRAKSKKQQASPIRFPKGKGSKSIPLRKPASRFTFFKKSSAKKSSNIRKKRNGNFRILIIPLLVVLLGGLVYISIKYVLSLRTNAFGDKTVVVNDVTGLQNIPEYPGSTFIYSDNTNNPTVKEFLAAGNSTYRLPDGKEVGDVETYYNEILPLKGWELVSTVPIGTEDKKYGQYWVKEGKGLRIYIKFRDVWYETITENDARTALADKVKEEIEREMLMASSEKQDLLPDYPWKIQIPKEYLIKYEATDFKTFTAVSFQKIGTNDKVILYPVAYTGSKELDYILEDYCEIISTEENTWKVLNTVISTFDSRTALKGTITANDSILNVAVIQNSSNNVAYVLSTPKDNDPMFGYILDNLKPIDVN